MRSKCGFVLFIMYKSVLFYNILLTITNKVNENATNVESNRIGLKTCQKLARSIGIGFESERQGEYFAVKMSLDATKED